MKSVKYVFFDTETTGLPRNYKAPTSDLANWPRMIQLSWICVDVDGCVLSEHDHLIYPKGFTIPVEVARLNGITNEIARAKGEPLEDVMASFIKDVDNAEIIVGHNVDFDIHIVGAEQIRLGGKDKISHKHSICTMQRTTDFCAIPGKYGYKYPKLQELHRKLFGYEFEDAHNAISDIRATLKCFLELSRRGLL